MPLWPTRHGLSLFPFSRRFALLMTGVRIRLAGATLLVALLWGAVWWALS